LIISNSVNYEATVAQDLVNIMNIAADKASLYGSGVLNNPLGLINLGVQTAGTSSTPLDADQPYAIVGQLDQANVPMISPGWIVNGKTRAWLNNLKTSTGAYIYRDELREGELAGYPLVVSNQLNYTAAGTYADFVFGDFSEFMWGEQTLLELEQSREASYLDSTGTLVSAFAQDATLIRAISRHDFNVKHPVSFVFATYKLASS
jgi:HK97 family phage major capsid protein